MMNKIEKDCTYTHGGERSLKLISQQEVFDLISLEKVTDFNELLEDNLRELKALYPNEANLDEKFKQYIDGKANPGDVASSELYHSFVWISRLYRNRPTIARIPYPISIARKYNCKTIMDFGGGGGTECIAYAKAGLTTTYSDKRDLKNTDTVRRRFQLRNLDIAMEDGRNLPKVEYDIITAYDVLEHLYDVEHYTAELVSRLRLNGFFIVYPDFDNITFDGDHLEKNVVYRDIFEKMLNVVGLEKIMEGPSLDVYKKMDTNYTNDLIRKDSEVKKMLYLFVKDHCGQVINESLAHLKSQNSPIAKTTLASRLGLSDTIRSVGNKLPIPQQVKRRAFRVYRKTFDENLLDKITDYYAVYRIVEHKLKKLGERR